MKKRGKIGRCLLIGAALLTSVYSYAQDNQKYSDNSWTPTVFSPLEGIQWVEQCVDQHPEILWLADSHVQKTEEGLANLDASYSEQLFGQKYVEFDRTITSIHCLKLILDGSDEAYQIFTASQPTDVKLSRESFGALHRQAQELLKSQWQGMSQLQVAQAMETVVVLGDIGKSDKARDLFKPYGIQAPDHDDFYGEAVQIILQHPTLCPSFSSLSTTAKQLLVKTAKLAHYGHITHLEGGPVMFDPLKESAIASKDPIALSFDLFVYTCDVAGALGHVNHQTSLVYTEPTHQAMQAMVEAVKVLSNPSKTQMDAYNSYLSVRASWLGLDASVHSDRVLSRIGAMLRLFTIEEGLMLRKAFHELDLANRNQIQTELDDHHQDLDRRTPTYMPAVLVNLSNNPALGKTKEERLTQAIIIGLPFIARVLERHRKMLLKKEVDSRFPLNFNRVAGIVKTSPHSLGGKFSIDREGTVHLVFE